MPQSRYCREKSPKRLNKDYDWDYDPKTYVGGNYEHDTPIPEDRLIGRGAINALKFLTDDKLANFKQGLHIGIGDVPRGSAIIAPLMDSPENGAEILMGDIGEKKLEATRRTMINLKLGKLGLWQPHEDDFASLDSRWIGSMQKAGNLGRVEELNIFDLPKDAFDIATAEHVFESATKDKDEYDEMTDIFYNSVRRGGIVHMAYVYGSGGYSVAGRKLPAYPVWPDTVERRAQMYLEDVKSYSMETSGQMREAGDEHGYGGLGVVVGRRR